MLKYKLTHPELLAALAAMGHGSRILLADANYSSDINVGPAAKRIYLNFAPGMLPVTDVLEKVLDAIPVEAAHMMLMDNGQEPPIAADFRKLLPRAVALSSYARMDFYAAALASKTSVVVMTGEQRLFANILLTVGVVNPDGTFQY